MSSYTAPTVSEFKAQFVRDFPYGTASDKVMDADILAALTQADFSVNPEIFDTEANFKYGYNLLAAHNLVMNLRASSQGVSGTYSWLEASKSVGSVSQSFSIPEFISKNPMYAMLSKTAYGAKYLEIVIPRAIGQCFAIEGATLP